MADEAKPPLGLSVGATNLAAVIADHAITRKPVLTLYGQRAPEVGIPSENPGLGQPGLVLTDFVDRVSDPFGIVAADGSIHRGEALLADGLRALAYAATGGRPLPESVAVTYPAHWESEAVDALGGALSRVSEWANPARPLMLIPDAAATLFAVRANPGLPGGGTVAVCDFGGTGTSITLMEAAGDYHALAPTVRLGDFCGDLIDQTLLTTVMGNMASTGALSAVGSLSRLRTGCRNAKEQLSTNTMTALVSGRGGDLRLSRDELDDAIGPSLNDFVAVLDETLAHNRIRDLVAVVSVGGVANIPAVTTTLARHLRVPVVTTPRPELTAAVGAALRAARGPGDTGATASAAAVTASARASVSWPRPATTVTGKAPRPLGLVPPLAWSEARDDSRASTGKSDGGSNDAAARPTSERKTRWYRLPAVAIIATAIAVLLVGTAAAIVLRSGDKSATTPAPGLSTTPASSAPNAATAPPPTPVTTDTNPATTDTNPPATTEAPTTTVPSAIPQAPQPAPAVRQVPRQAPAVPRIPAVPALPPIPGINEPIPGLDRVNQILQEIAGGAGLR